MHRVSFLLYSLFLSDSGCLYYHATHDRWVAKSRNGTTIWLLRNMLHFRVSNDKYIKGERLEWIHAFPHSSSPFSTHTSTRSNHCAATSTASTSTGPSRSAHLRSRRATLTSSPSHRENG